MDKIITLMINREFWPLVRVNTLLGSGILELSFHIFIFLEPKMRSFAVVWE